MGKKDGRGECTRGGCIVHLFGSPYESHILMSLLC
jgi:hypothetical protein